MDLGLFPKDQMIPVVVLIDMSAELYEPDESGINAMSNANKIVTRNFANVVMTRYVDFFLLFFANMVVKRYIDFFFLFFFVGHPTPT